jgi:hypothetical protein
MALEFFGKLVRQAQGGNRSNLVFRADISRPQWERDVLNQVIDLNVSGGFSNYRPWLEDWRERYGQEIWTYGDTPNVDKTALGIVLQALDLYSRGVRGFTPWLTLGTEKAWNPPELKDIRTAVFYQGKSMGIQGPCASLRLKAYRRGEQDVEYVWLLAEKEDLFKNDPNRLRINELVSSALKVNKSLGTLDEHGAVTEFISDVQPEALEDFRRAIATKLSN